MEAYQNALWGYLISIVGGGIVLFFFHKWLRQNARRLLKNNEQGIKNTYFMPALMGIIERFLFTILIGYDINASGAFIGGWITAKAIGGWSKINTDYDKEMFATNIMLSGTSALFGILGGLIFRYGMKIF